MEERASIAIYSQLTCPTSYRLYKRLRDEKLLDRVSIVDAGLSPFESLYRGVISVPAIFYGGVMIYSGYFDIDEAVGVIRGGGLPVIRDFDYGEASVLAMEGILDSYATALWLYLTDNIESPLSQRPFIEAVSRHVFYEGRSGESYEKLAREVRSLYEGERSLYRERLREIVARNIVREIIWLGRDPGTARERLDREYIEHMLLARASIGRIGLIMGYPLKPHMEGVEDLYRFLRESWGELYEKVLRETRKILGDREYVEDYISRVSRRNP